MSAEQQDGSPRVRRVAVMGNVSVGKTCLFDQLCDAGNHAVNIAGSTMEVRRGVLSVGVGAAPRAFHGHCAACGRQRGRLGAYVGACAAETKQPCPAQPGAIESHWIPFWPVLSRAPKPQSAVPTYWPVEGPSITHLFDTPGSAMLGGGSEDEMVARDLLLAGKMDAVLLVADAKNLRRALALAFQVAEFRIPMVVDLNMLDEAEAMGLELDDGELTRGLGVPVGRTVAVESRGIRRLAELVLDAQVPTCSVVFPDAVERALAELEALLVNPSLRPRALGILLIGGDRGAEGWVGRQLGESVRARAAEVVASLQRRFSTPLPALMADSFHEAAAALAERVITRTASTSSLLVRFGDLAQRPLTGSLIALVVLALSYLWVGAFAATYLVDLISARLFEGVLIPFAARALEVVPWTFARDAIMDPDFGLLPTGLALAVGVVLPVLFCFYLLQAVLEDSGYLPRLAVLFDRGFRWLGLNGQGLIPLVLGLSCTTMAIITTRTLPSKKERIIATLLLIGLPCAPLLATMLVVLGAMSWYAAVAVIAVIGLRLMVAGLAARRVIAGERPDLILELPRMRVPRPRVLLEKTFRRSFEFLREAVPVFLAASFVVFVFDRLGGLALVEEGARPVVQLMGLPDASVHVFIKTAIRREAGTAELSRMGSQFTDLQKAITLLVMVLSMPCINTSIVMVKERGLRVAAAALGASLAFAIVLGALVNLVLRGWTLS
jgi:ferrous iron transport protein B